ncbi:hypothetical protein N665_0012s0242 [Sinapis alba]|nr:hypothetical protein N665_0012s0242 [Sinapis alba]
MKISRDEEEGHLIRQRREEDENETETDRAKEDSLTILELNRELEEKCKLKKLEALPTKINMENFKEKQQLNHPKDKNEDHHLSICNGCNSEIEDGLFIFALGAIWHCHCLCCLHCHKPIAMDERKFHRLCYKEHRRPNCYVCRKKIPSTNEGIKYHKHPFWEDKYCPSHDDDGTAKCCSCERLQACGTEYVMLADNRRLCLECKESAVMDTDESQSLHYEIREFFEGLNMKVEKVFPLLLVGKQALNKSDQENIYGVVTRGICLTEEKIITRVPSGSNKQLVGEESQRVVRKPEVIAILILYGLPRFLTGYILAHEMMHAYLRLKGYRNLSTILEEGICQVLGHMWLESQRCSTSNAASRAKNLVEFCIHQIETDESAVYGDGFKKVNEMMVSNHYNLMDTLKDIDIASKTLPAGRGNNSKSNI